MTTYKKERIDLYTKENIHTYMTNQDKTPAEQGANGSEKRRPMFRVFVNGNRDATDEMTKTQVIKFLSSKESLKGGESYEIEEVA